MGYPSFSLSPLWEHELRLHFSSLTCAGCLFFTVPLVMQRTSQRRGNVTLLHSKKSTQTFLHLLCKLLFAPSMSWSSLLVFNSLQESIFKTVSEGHWDCIAAFSATTGNSCFLLYFTYHLCQWKKNPPAI